MKKMMPETHADLLRVLKNTTKALEYAMQFMGEDLFLQKCQATLAAAKSKIKEEDERSI